MIPQFNDQSITVAIVGCGGFIGCHLLDAILTRTKWRVFGVDLDFYRIQHRLNDERCEFMVADLADKSVVERIAKYPIVVNLAAICVPSRYMAEAPEVIRSNYDHPAALADACAKSGSWLIHFSTSEIYGRTPADSGLLVEDESELTFGPVTASRWSYATAKLLTERYIAGLKNLKWTVVRPFNFVGPYMDFMPGVDGSGIPRVLANFSSALVRGEPLKLVNGGVAKRSFTSVFDAVNFMFALFEAGDVAFSQAFNIGNPENELTIAELANKMRKIFAEIKSVNVETIPEPEVVSGVEYYGEGYEDSMRRLPSVEKAERLLGFKAKTPIDVVLRESLTWFVNHYGSEIN
ncbi:NAD-dependent epimerase/dehydratase family protein [Fibrobacter succinogenes]|uniref:UDP-apiose/xylose synthase n=1 Tax=Fibrobacter succinogenes TaxID=833 RepID=A0A380S9J4_FIBSU|nr:NAD-dependent epimerase/dehydratase family protein [Fibrobacter succinogenes]PWJ33617.1 UDP-apiose/xylose synthase [Fibrobacter succinogenes subsp. elongatus]SUQ25988.1 UDP-apiose/xylose synthase [Fibrobacter succinogenes]